MFPPASLAIRPKALDTFKQGLLQGMVEVGDAFKLFWVVLAGEAVIEQVWREPRIELSEEALGDAIGAAHHCAFCCMAAAMS